MARSAALTPSSTLAPIALPWMSKPPSWAKKICSCLHRRVAGGRSDLEAGAAGRGQRAVAISGAKAVILQVLAGRGLDQRGTGPAPRRHRAARPRQIVVLHLS